MKLVTVSSQALNFVFFIRVNNIGYQLVPDHIIPGKMDEFDSLDVREDFFDLHQA
jgi:hypothetical protein